MQMHEVHLNYGHPLAQSTAKRVAEPTEWQVQSLQLADDSGTSTPCGTFLEEERW